jgi:NAD(P)-dependent dehydrogenase (short-subunit alcohol dehydrogenase family)
MKMTDKFDGKIAVVTGGSTGMGLSTAKRFVQEEGMDHVFITARRKDSLDGAVAEIGKSVTGIQDTLQTCRTSTTCTTRSISTIDRSTFSSPTPVSQNSQF